MGSLVQFTFYCFYKFYKYRETLENEKKNYLSKLSTRDEICLLFKKLVPEKNNCHCKTNK